ncbi:hypothetical protein BVE84_06795 [Streptococcus azizii]|uniref:DUF5655 domain-containing protein n=1 Tax=Streptococcus azizii TaxID=1579424 RepID=A0AB36JPN1_9STRE|nr:MULTISPECIES: DUF5655 domain-containing protein [Streptococcus]MBF0775399.1 hypothetical protein [Streptococcus sp. 19428wD3_AN2]ONK26762.1 hypothetical protein BVE86_06615 [Streptococcus azizii]ONK27329.1 hypothetical protein BVE85_06600 [Streptococcus azizii]ONK28273.1 hypothetical protein BVE84_06795 [Streptococcus azizii]TFU84567.1 hypothetical protein E4T83_01220 [Streptococcus sp. AN2]
MNLFNINQNKLISLEEKPFKLEREFQCLFEENLTVITGLEFVGSEFSIQNQRIDTLAFDTESKSFVIIEYKKSTNYSVLDQGVSYLNTLLKYKADFILGYQEKTGKLLRKNVVDWSQSKVVFVSPNFTSFQKQAVDFKDLNIELWEVKRFQNDLLLINGVNKSKNAPSIKTSISEADSELALVTKELKTYSEEDLLVNKSEGIVELYETFKEAIFQLIPDSDLVATKLYMAFKQGKRNIVDIEIQNKQLKLFINAKFGEIEDPKELTRNVSTIGHYGNGEYEIRVVDTKHLEYIMSLIKQII